MLCSKASEIPRPGLGSVYHSNLAVRVLYDTGMLLYPSSSLTPWNTTFRNMEGQIIFQTESLMLLGSPRRITIKRVLPSNSIDLATGHEDALRDFFSDLAEIHYKIFSSRIRYNGTEMATTQFFRKSSFLGRWELKFDCLQFLFNISLWNLQSSSFYWSRWQRIRMEAGNQCMQCNKWSLTHRCLLNSRPLFFSLSIRNSCISRMIQGL